MIGRLALSLLLLISTPGDAQADRRVALVLGNSGYRYVGSLDTPKSDARKLADTFERLGFKTIRGFDVNYIEFREVLADFERKLQSADVGLFYYAGHGVQYQGSNYLVPVDASFQSVETLPINAINLNVIQGIMESTARTALLFIDACRNNPIRSQVSSDTRNLSLLDGLAIPQSGKIGTFIAYSTAPGSLAYDGTGENSPYAEAILRNIEKPGVELSQLMIAVRGEVYESTGMRQRPWESTSLLEQFYFSPVVARLPELPSVTIPRAPVEDAYQATTHPRERLTGSEVSVPSPAEQPLPAEIERAQRRPSVDPREDIIPAGTVQPEHLAAIDPDFKKAAPGPLSGQETGIEVAPMASSQENVETDDIVEEDAALKATRLMVQEHLNRLGCSAGYPDGIWGPRSTAALERFASAKGLVVRDITVDDAFLQLLATERRTVCETSIPALPNVVEKQVPVKPAAPRKCYSFNGNTLCN